MLDITNWITILLATVAPLVYSMWHVVSNFWMVVSFFKKKRSLFYKSSQVFFLSFHIYKVETVRTLSLHKQRPTHDTTLEKNTNLHYFLVEYSGKRMNGGECSLFRERVGLDLLGMARCCYPFLRPCSTWRTKREERSEKKNKRYSFVST